jgi:hypothetical protein
MYMIMLLLLYLKCVSTVYSKVKKKQMTERNMFSLLKCAKKLAIKFKKEKTKEKKNEFNWLNTKIKGVKRTFVAFYFL